MKPVTTTRVIVRWIRLAVRSRGFAEPGFSMELNLKQNCNENTKANKFYHHTVIPMRLGIRKPNGKIPYGSHSAKFWNHNNPSCDIVAK